MKLNRRGFFGFSAGAAIAAPAAVKEATISQAGSGAISHGASYGAYPTCVDDGVESFEEIVRLVKQARGKLTDRDLSERALYNGSSEYLTRGLFEEVESLRSVSASYKNRMAVKIIERQQDARERRSAAHDLLYRLRIPEALWKDYE